MVYKLQIRTPGATDGVSVIYDDITSIYLAICRLTEQNNELDFFVTARKENNDEQDADDSWNSCLHWDCSSRY